MAQGVAVGDGEHERARPGQRAELGDDGLLARGVEVRRGLVEQDDGAGGVGRGLAEHPGEGEAASLARGQRAAGLGEGRRGVEVEAEAPQQGR